MKGEDRFTMEETKRYGVMATVLAGGMTLGEAAAALQLSRRQVQRVKKRVVALGPQGVVHGNKGRASPRSFPPEVRERVTCLAKTLYQQFNFTHLSEMLEEREGLRVNRETLRLWLRGEGLGRKLRKVAVHRKKRPRSTQEGKILFLDGSPHPWFAGLESTLILCTDDATGKPLYGLFQEQEDLEGCFRVCHEVFQRYGLPASFYLDKASQFTTTRQGGLRVAQSDRKPTQFERAMRELGVRIIFAHSPQARGRGERINGTFQDRLVAELDLHGITTAQEATRYLNDRFLPRYHRRFAVPPADPVAAWRPLPANLELHNVLCKRFERTVTNDNTVSIRRRIIQLLPTSSRTHFVRAKVVVNLWLDSSFHVFLPRHGEVPCRLLQEIGLEKVRPASGARPAESPKSLGPASVARALPSTKTPSLTPAAHGG